MRSQRYLRDELRFLTEFGALFDVVEQGAVSQLRRLDERLAGATPLGDVLEREFFPLLPPLSSRHPLVRGGTRGRLVVVVTSDEGLVGFLHTAVIREALARAGEGSHWIFVGQRGVRLLGARVANAHVMPMPSEEEADGQLKRLAQFVLERYRRQALRDVWVISPRFVSMTRQEVAARQLLPLPWRGAAKTESLQDLVIEPSADRVVEQLAARWVEAVCRDVFWSARRAEFAARTLHIESSRQELAKQTKLVQHAFFKTMHERVDIMVRETCVVQRHVVRRKAAQAGVTR